MNMDRIQNSSPPLAALSLHSTPLPIIYILKIGNFCYIQIISFFRRLLQIQIYCIKNNKQSIPIQWATGALSPGAKEPGCEANHSPPTSAEVKKT
jgi:hypothetical protein